MPFVWLSGNGSRSRESCIFLLGSPFCSMVNGERFIGFDSKALGSFGMKKINSIRNIYYLSWLKPDNKILKNFLRAW